MHKLREYFNPRSHEGSDQLRSRQQPRDQISILAPTRGATHAQSDISYQTMISILAPTRGATATSTITLCSKYYFNPRSHEGSDSLRYRAAYCSRKFQSSLPRGERHACGLLSATHGDFNPRSHEGSDCVVPGAEPDTTYFNPRSHEGSD